MLDYIPFLVLCPPIVFMFVEGEFYKENILVFYYFMFCLASVWVSHQHYFDCSLYNLHHLLFEKDILDGYK